jgi:DNA-binding IscR family transcriptional regulator
VLCSHHDADAQHCATKLLWTRVQLGVIRSLQRTTLAELVAFASKPSGAPSALPLEIHSL